MGPRNKLNLFILVTLLSQAISVFSDENIDGSTNAHVRKKRLIDPKHRGPVTIDKVPYIVSLRKNNIIQCGAIVLKANILLTAAHCVTEAGVTYNILANSSIAHHGSYHSVKNLQKHAHFNNTSYANDLALLYVYPPINLYSGFNRVIEFYNGPLDPGTPVTVTGWGCEEINGNTLVLPGQLRQITVPILSPIYCRHAHARVDSDRDEYICFSDPVGWKRSCYGDTGGPVVIDGKLAGVLSWPPSSDRFLPDIAINLANHAYRTWVTTTMKHLELLGG